MRIDVLGAGAFGTALAVALCASDHDITLIGRDAGRMAKMRDTRRNDRLPDVPLPGKMHFDTQLNRDANVVLLTVPAQTLGATLTEHRKAMMAKPLVACCKGIDLTTLTGPADIIAQILPDATPLVLTGPSFAADIARGLPTALTLACQDGAIGAYLQSAVSTPTLRLYRTTDVTGAQLGGALKNVMAIACGATIGAGLGDSARAALMTRGFAEMVRLAQVLGAESETLSGLSGFGDLALTCTSDQSRNYRYGHALGSGTSWDASVTVEGAATAQAATGLAQQHAVDVPVTRTVAALVSGELTVDTALNQLLSRPLKEE